MAIMGLGEIVKGSLLAASYVLKHGATLFHQKPASCVTDSSKPTSHYWPKSCSGVLRLSKGAPSFKIFSNAQANLPGVPAGVGLGILCSISEVKPLKFLAITFKENHTVFEENPKSTLSSIIATEIDPGVFSDTSVENHSYLRGDELSAKIEEAETNTDTTEGLESLVKLTKNVESPIQISEEVLEGFSNLQGKGKVASDREFEGQMEDDLYVSFKDFVEGEEVGILVDQPGSGEVSEEQEMEEDRSETSEGKNDWLESLPSRTDVESSIKVANGSLTDLRLSGDHDINLDDLPEERAPASIEDCLNTTDVSEAASYNENHINLNHEQEELLGDVQKDHKGETTVKAPLLKPFQAATRAYYSVPEDCSTSEDSTIITAELAKEVNKVPVSNPISDHAVDLEAASESATSEGPAVITAVDLGADSKNKSSSEDPANLRVDQVIDHPVASSFVFGSGSLESQIKFSEGWDKVLGRGSSSPLVFKSDMDFWKLGETFARTSAPDIEFQPSATAPFHFGTSSRFNFGIPTLASTPSSDNTEKATKPSPFFFEGSLNVPKMPTASSFHITETTATSSFQFGQNPIHDFKFGGPKAPIMPLAPASTLHSPDEGIPKPTVTEGTSLPSVKSTPPGSPRSADSSRNRPLAIPKRRKMTTGADSGYGSGMSDKSASPPPPEFVSWPNQAKPNTQTPEFLASRSIVATVVKDPTVEDAVDEYDEGLSGLDSGVDLESVWDPAVPEESGAMKRLKEKLAAEEEKELDEPEKELNESKTELEERKKEQQEQLKAAIGMKQESRKKKGGKNGKKGKKGKKEDDNTPADQVAAVPAATEKGSPKEKAQKCKSSGRVRFRNGKCGQGLVEPVTAT